MKVFNLLAACTVLLASSSCDHKELCYDHPHIGRVNVVFDWTNAPNANPETMSLYLYPKDGGAPERYEFIGRNGGSIEILEGEYTAICINSDTEKIRYSFPSSSTYGTADTSNLFEVNTESTEIFEPLGVVSKASAPRAEGAEDERVAYPAEALWTDTQYDVTIKSIKVVDQQTITLYPQQAVCNYTVKILNINNAVSVTKMSATLSGMAGGLYVAQRRATDEVVTHPFAVDSDAATATGTANFYTFGHCPDPYTVNTHSVVVYAVMSDGNKYYYSVDVTEQVQNAPDPYNVVIVIEELPLPDLISAGGGLGSSVNEWEDVTVELSMKTYSD